MPRDAERVFRDSGIVIRKYASDAPNVSILNVFRLWQPRLLPIPGQQTLGKVNPLLKFANFSAEPVHLFEQGLVALLEVHNPLAPTELPFASDAVRDRLPDG